MTYECRTSLEKNGGLQRLQVEFKLRPPQVTVLKELVKFWQPEVDGCKPTIETLSQHTGFPYRTVQDAIAGLTDKGLITRGPEAYFDRRGRKRPGKINSYHFAGVVIDAIAGNFERPDRHAARVNIGTQPVSNRHAARVNNDTQPVSEKVEVELGNNEEVEFTPKSPETERGNSRAGTPTATPDGVIRESGEGGRLPFMDRGQWIDELRAVNVGEREKTIRAAVRDHGGHINGESIPHTVDAGVAFLENAFDQIGLVL